MISSGTKIPIHYEDIGALMGKQTKTIELFQDQIKGCRVFNHVIAKGDTVHFAKEQNGHHVLILVTGTASFLMDGATHQFSVRACFAPGLDQDLDVRGDTDVQLLEIFWELAPEDREELEGYFTSLFPKMQIYRDAMQYHDHAKSWKTINRIFLEQGNIPRFAMGSVESYGPDMVQQHPHPQIDQFFYSFPENDMDLLIDDDVFTQKGNVLVHIPLGSNHGVNVPEGRRMHYLWIDFWADPKVSQMLAQGHVKTGLKRDFADEGYAPDGKAT